MSDNDSRQSKVRKCRSTAEGGEPFERTSSEGKQRSNQLQLFDQVAAACIQYESATASSVPVHDSTAASRASEVESSNRQDLAAMIYRQQYQQMNDTSLLTQRRYHPSHDFQLAVALATSRDSQTSGVANAMFHNDNTLWAANDAVQQRQAQNALLQHRLHDPTFASLHAISGNSIMSNLIHQREIGTEAAERLFLPANKQLLVDRRRNEGAGFTPLFQPHTMRLSSTSDNNNTCDIRSTSTIDRYRSTSSSTANYFSEASYQQKSISSYQALETSPQLPEASQLPHLKDRPSQKTAPQLLEGTLTSPQAAAPVPMSSETDVHHLSKYQCLIRKQLEFFAATSENAVFNVQGRKKPIRIGQVGIQCRHCCHLPPRTRGRGAVYYPATLDGVYQAVQNMATVHLNQRCSKIPSVIRDELKLLRGKRDESVSTGGKYYWTSKCEDAGVVEYDGGIMFTSR